jgi:TonB-dependent SusC/RagA subfamily outer membrane receptor
MKKLFYALLITVLILSSCSTSKHSSSSNKASLDKALFVIDGLPSTKSAADKLTKERIASITVLKGEPAKALYGKRAKHGAVLITTKK